MRVVIRMGAYLLIVAMTAATDAIAQFRGGVPGGGGMPGGGARGGRDGQMGRDQRPGGEQHPAVQEDLVALAEYRLELLRVDLKLAPNQESSWKTYADKVSALAADMSRERVRVQSTLQMKSLQRIDQSVDVARNRLTALEDIAAAAKTLYAHLAPEQQSLADARLATTIPAVSAAGMAGIPGLRDAAPPPR